MALEGEVPSVANLCFGKALVVFPVPCPGLFTPPRWGGKGSAERLDVPLASQRAAQLLL